MKTRKVSTMDGKTANNKGVYIDANNVDGSEDSNGGTTEDSNFDPNENSEDDGHESARKVEYINVSNDDGDNNDDQDENLGNSPIPNMNDPPLLKAERDNQTGLPVPGVLVPGVPAPEEHLGDNFDGGSYHRDDENNDDLSMDAMADAEKDRHLDAGAVEMENEDVYHPGAQTLSIQQVMGK